MLALRQQNKEKKEKKAMQETSYSNLYANA